MVKTEYFTDPADYCKVFFDSTRVIQSINLIEENMVAVSSIFEDDFVEIMSNTNVVIAAYTTAQARLKLYWYLERLQDRICYFDTGKEHSIKILVFIPLSVSFLFQIR